MPIERIVVGVDGSDNARLALSWAIDLAQRVGAEIVAVHALGLLARLDGAAPTPAQHHRDEIKERLERVWCAPLHETSLTSRCLLRDGNPVTVLLGVAQELEADLIVVGSRGLGGFPELLLGSTSAQVVQHAACVVAIVPSPHRPAV